MHKEINKNKLRILLTGANGFVGKNLKNNLLKKKFKVFTPSKKDLNLLNYNKINKYLKNKKNIKSIFIKDKLLNLVVKS